MTTRPTTNTTVWMLSVMMALGRFGRSPRWQGANQAVAAARRGAPVIANRMRTASVYLRLPAAAWSQCEARMPLAQNHAHHMRFVAVSRGCADPAHLAEFTCSLGGRRLWTRPTSAAVQTPGVLLISQRVAGYQPPEWPGASVVHLGLTAGEQLEDPTRRAIALGDRLANPQPDPRRWRVLLDPAGHLFCITTLTPPPNC